MNRFLLMLLLVSCWASIGFGQKSVDEKEILKYHLNMDAALVTGDLSVFEKLFAHDYSYSNNFGKLYSRAQNLAYLKDLFEAKDFKVVANRSDNIRVRVNGISALVTADWATTGLVTDDPNAEPHVDLGRITSYYEKRRGKWSLVAEHSSEQQHDVKMMERQLAVLGRKYSDMIRRNDEASIRQILADDYLLADENGKVYTKAEDLATYKDRVTTVKIDKVEYLDQKIQVISNNSAIDHSTIRFVGSRSGKPFDITERCTTIWSFKNGRWQIVSDHFSYIKPQGNVSP